LHLATIVGGALVLSSSAWMIRSGGDKATTAPHGRSEQR
jgi:hypothetical protein